jgi:hypothetical protein
MLPCDALDIGRPSSELQPDHKALLGVTRYGLPLMVGDSFRLTDIACSGLSGSGASQAAEQQYWIRASIPHGREQVIRLLPYAGIR